MDGAHGLRHPYVSERLRVGFDCEGESLTVQAEAESCDLNVIVKRFGMANLVESHRRAQLRYEELPPQMDYQEALLQIEAAHGLFMALPSGLRKRFNNNPAEFLDFVDDPENADELVALGLRKGPESREAPAPADPDPVAPVDDSAGVAAAE